MLGSKKEKKKADPCVVSEPGPNDRGPVPEPFSIEHAHLVPELSRRGGLWSFHHDVGMAFGSSEWVIDAKVVDSRDIAKELLAARGLVFFLTNHPDDEDGLKKAGKCCFDFWIGYMAWGAVLKKPDFWEKSPVFEGRTFCEPDWKIEKHEKYDDKWICRVSYWKREDREEEREKQKYSKKKYSDDEEEEVLDVPKQWTRWERCYACFNLSVLRTGQYSDEQIGYFLGSGREKDSNGRWVAAFKTSRDGMQLSNQPDYSFDVY